MAILRFSMTARTRTSTTKGGAALVQYLVREGAYKPETQYLMRQSKETRNRDDLRHTELVNLPAWTQGDPARFFDAAMEYERANGRYATAIVMALPRELSHEQHLAFTREFMEAHLHNKVALWVKHEPVARDGETQPHIHILMSERSLDGIERGPEQFFRRYNPDHPAQGGAKKDRFWNNVSTPERLRESWAILANYHLEHAGQSARVDPRSLEAQGIDRTPQRKWSTEPSGRDVKQENAIATQWWHDTKQQFAVDITTLDQRERIALVQAWAHRRHEAPRMRQEELGQAITATQAVLAQHEAELRMIERREAQVARNPERDTGSRGGGLRMKLWEEERAYGD